MNVFEFLGLPANHRSDDKVVHRVKNLHEVPETKLNWPAWAQEKLDGVYAIVVTNEEGEVGIFSRTGKKFVNCDLLCYEVKNHPNYDSKLIYLCELVCTTLSLEELSGAVNPNRTEPLTTEVESNIIGFAKLVCFDVVRKSYFILGKSSSHFSIRFSNDFLPIERVRTKVVYSIEDFTDFAKSITDAGGEGAVLKQLDAPWIAGKKDHSYTKLVCGCDYDLEVIDVEEGKGKRKGMVANLILRWRMYGMPEGVVTNIPVDGRFDDTTRIRWWNNPALIIGKIVHVHALQLGSKGLLRLAKVREVRIDKTVADL